MRAWIEFIVVWFILFLLVMAFRDRSSSANDYHIVDLQELSIDYKNYGMLNDKARDPLIYPIHPKEGINIGMNLDVLEYGYLDTIVESLTSTSKYESVGLQLRLGVRLSDNLEVGYAHHSQHLLDHTFTYMDKFPSEDAVQLKIYLYRGKKREGML